MKIRFYSIVIAVLCFVLPTEIIAQKYHETAKLTSLDRHVDSQIGFDVDLHGNYAIIGAPREYLDANGNDSTKQAGAAYIMEQNLNGEWLQVAKLTPKKRNQIDYFGSEVQINNRFAVVGSYFKNTVKSGTNELSSGAVYIYERDADGIWSFFQEIIPDDKEASQNFGWSIDLEDDKLVIGSPLKNYEDNDGNIFRRLGAVYVYNFTDDKNWHFVQKLNAEDGAENDYFGHDVSILNETIVVGAIQESDVIVDKKYADNMGAVYVFEMSTDSTWYETQKIVASDRSGGSGFGGTVKMHKEEIIVGDYRHTTILGSDTVDNSGAIYVFKKSMNGIWEEEQKIIELNNPENEYFGSSIDIDKDVLCVGSFFHYDAMFGLTAKAHGGAVKLYKKNSDGQWSFTQLIHGEDREHYDESGGAVAIYNDKILMASRRNDYDANQENYIKDAGAVYVFETCKPKNSFLKIEACDSLLAPSGRRSWFESGTYFDTLTAVNNCDSIINIELTIQDFEVQITELDGKLTADAPGAIGYTWYRCMDKTLIPIMDANNKSFRPSESGKYAVGVINKDRCTAVSSCFDFVITQLDNLANSEDFNIYPNPFIDYITVVNSTESIIDIQLIDVYGQILMKWDQVRQKDTRLNTPKLVKGIYFIQISHDKEQKVFKLIK